MPDFIFSARNIVDGAFGNDPADTSYLIVPDNEQLDPKFIVAQNDWLSALINADESKEDILIFIHGYNDSEMDVLGSHRAIKQGLSAAGYTGQVASFDWPCANVAAVYLEDRHKATITSLLLVDGGIAVLAEQQNNKCTVNVHLIAHSTGALVVREAFEHARTANKLKTQDWCVSQIVLISGDISSNSMVVNCKCDAVYDHCIRLTTFQNPYDRVLALSNVKRIGFENRVGRVGLPDGAPPKCVNVNSGDMYQSIKNNGGDTIPYSHSWYFDSKSNTRFMADLCLIIQGDIDRNVFPTRSLVNGVLTLA
jgi:esterase/lipase superfamily enzyme